MKTISIILSSKHNLNFEKCFNVIWNVRHLRTDCTTISQKWKTVNCHVNSTRDNHSPSLIIHSQTDSVASWCNSTLSDWHQGSVFSVLQHYSSKQSENKTIKFVGLFSSSSPPQVQNYHPAKKLLNKMDSIFTICPSEYNTLWKNTLEFPVSLEKHSIWYQKDILKKGSNSTYIGRSLFKKNNPSSLFFIYQFPLKLKDGTMQVLEC